MGNSYEDSSSTPLCCSAADPWIGLNRPAFSWSTAFSSVSNLHDWVLSYMYILQIGDFGILESSEHEETPWTCSLLDGANLIWLIFFWELFPLEAMKVTYGDDFYLMTGTRRPMKGEFGLTSFCEDNSPVVVLLGCTDRTCPSSIVRLLLVLVKQQLMP